MTWKHHFPKLYRVLVKARFALAREKVISTPFGAQMHINPHSFSERLIAAGGFEKKRVVLFDEYLAPGAVFFDIGANVGFYTLLARARGAEVHAFEPEPLNLKRLRANLALNCGFGDCTTVWPVALGSCSGEVEFGRPLSDNYGHASLLVDGGFDRIRVPMKRFAEIPVNPHWSSIYKLDVEGAEQQVLQGLGAAWDVRVPTVFLVEVHRQYGADLAAIVTEFRSRGFVVTYLDDESGEEHSLAPAEGDLALVARRDCAKAGKLNAASPA